MSIIHRIARWFTPHGERPGRLAPPDELVLIMRPNGEPEAQFLKEMLDENGVRALVKNRDPVSAQSGGMGPAWAYELWVLRKDVPRAGEILELEE